MEAWTHSQMREAAGTLYKPLKPWQSRVLRLHPGEDGDDLCADLLVAGLAHKEGFHVSEENELTFVHYEAISYCWGTADFKNIIRVNGTEYRISTSLAGALRVFRRIDVARYLWADAICINQYDEEEKSQQVSRMKSIFSMASQVLVWLGREGLNSAAAIAALNSGPPLDADELTEETLKGLLDICSRPWPRRVWVQQEVYFARAIQIYCGPSNLSMALYNHGASLLGRIAEDLELAYPGITSRIDAIDNLSIASPTDSLELDVAAAEECEAIRFRRTRPIGADSKHFRFSFECVWDRLGSINATDARDHVYGLLGMTSCEVVPLKSNRTPGPLALQVNYGLSVSEVFQQMTKHLINRDASLSLFGRNFIFGTASTDLELPSWTINWSIQPPSERRYCYGFTACRRGDPERRLHKWDLSSLKFEGSPVLPNIFVQSDVADGELHLTGCILCTIQDVSFRCRDEHYDTLGITISSRLRKENAERDESRFLRKNSERKVGRFVLDDVGPRHCSTHEVELWRYSDGVERGMVAGDILAQLDGIDSDYLCLRPQHDGRYAIVCQLDDVFLLHGDAATVEGEDTDVYIRLPVESRREFIIC